MTFKYVQSWSYGLCLWKIIIDSSAFFLFFYSPQAMLSPVVEKFCTSEVFKAAPHPGSTERVKGVRIWARTVKIFNIHTYFWNPFNLIKRWNVLFQFRAVTAFNSGSKERRGVLMEKRYLFKVLHTKKSIKAVRCTQGLFLWLLHPGFVASFPTRLGAAKDDRAGFHIHGPLNDGFRGFFQLTYPKERNLDLSLHTSNQII